MDWLFIPIGKFFVWYFQFVELAAMKFNYIMMAIGTLLTIYWVIQMKKAKTDKGFFKRS